MAEPIEQGPRVDEPQLNPNLDAPPAALPVPVSPAEASPPASLGRLDLLLLALLMVLAFLLGSFAAANSDVWLQLASGRRIAQGEWTVGVDPFSFATEAGFTHPAVRWVEHSWLYAARFLCPLRLSRRRRFGRGESRGRGGSPGAYYEYPAKKGRASSP